MKRLLILVLVCFLAVSGFRAHATKERPQILSQEEEAQFQKQMEVLTDIVAYIATYALDRPQDIASCVTEMMAMRRLGKCRDKFSYYLPPEEAEEQEEDLKGEFSGVGLELTQKDDLVIVVTPLEGSPAERAGFKPEDIILKVDGKEVKSLREAVMLIRGPEGSKAEIEIFRKGSKESIKFVVTKGKITIHPVKSRDITARGQKIGVVKINSFSEIASSEFKEALAQIKKKKIKTAVLDLRNNPGGLLNEALKMLALFMKPNDVTITHRTRYAQDPYDAAYLRRELNVRNFGEFRYLKIVVLINKGSASASEIFAGAMKDWGYPVVGEKSFGKGTGQTAFDLSDGSKLLLTTFEFLVGNSRTPIRDKGVLPNYLVLNQDDQKKDLQMEKAIEILMPH